MRATWDMMRDEEKRLVELRVVGRVEFVVDDVGCVGCVGCVGQWWTS